MLLLLDRQTLSGNIQRTTFGYRVFFESGVAIDVPEAAVRKVVWGDDEHVERIRRRATVLGASSVGTRGRSIVGPTALPIGERNGYISQREIAATIVGVGITDGIEVSGGAVLPTLLTETSRVAALGAKISVPVGQSITTALGVQTLFLPGPTAWAAPHALVTWTPPRAAYTLGGGAAVDLASGETVGLVMLSADWRIGPKVSLLAEILVLSGALPYGNGTVGMPSAAGRFYLGAWSIDAGLVPFDASFGTGGTILPLPWLDLTWNFVRQD